MEPAALVHVVDDNDFVRHGLARLLEIAGYEVQEHASAEALLAGQLSTDRVVVVLTDLVLPGMDGIGLASRLRETAAAPPVVFLSGHGAISSSVQAMKGGAIDFLQKPVGERELLDAVGRAAACGREILQERQRMAGLRARYTSLTPREREVFALVVSGLLNKQAAAKLEVSEKTVKVHRAHAIRKMGAQSLADLVRMAVHLGIAPEPGRETH
jgi:FixJ family two-component response regulator